MRQEREHARRERGSNALHARYAVSIAAIFLLIAIVPALVQAAPRTRSSVRSPAGIAVIRYIKLGLSVTPPHHAPAKGKVRESLFAAYLLQTSARQKASLTFKDGTLLHMNQRTEATLRSPSLTYVQKGEVDEQVTPGSGHRIQTAAAVASAIGTEYDVLVKGKTTIVTVVEGAVMVTAKHHTVVVKTGQQTQIVVGKAPSKPKSTNARRATAWVRTIPPPQTAPGENIGLDSNGGSVLVFSSERGAASSTLARHQASSGGTPGPWDVRNINDGSLTTGWQSAEGAVTNQIVVVGFFEDSTHPLTAVVLDCAASGGQDPENDLKDFQILVSTTDTAAGSFTTAMTGTCSQSSALQRFDLPSPMEARYVELVALDNHGGTGGIAVTELELVSPDRVVPAKPGTPSTSPATVTPTPTSTPTPTPTDTPTATPTDTPTDTPTPTATDTPISTPTPTNTPTPIPTPMPTPTSTCHAPCFCGCGGGPTATPKPPKP